MNFGCLSFPATVPWVKTEVFTSSGIWLKPSWAKTIFIEGLGGGGGGGSGSRRSTSGSINRWGGWGGAGGVYAYLAVLQEDLPQEVAITIGAGGLGGASILSDDTDGAAGNPGGNSTFGSYFTAFGGDGGPAATLLAMNNLAVPFRAGVDGGWGGIPSSIITQITDARYYGQTAAYGGGGGGAGASRTTTSVVRNSEAGGGIAKIHPFGGTGGGSGQSSAATALAGGVGSSVDVSLYLCGGAGGGGGGITNSTTTGNGAEGGAGGYPAGGGGGGGQAPNSYTSGAGGAGAAGIIRVRCFPFFVPELFI